MIIQTGSDKRGPSFAQKLPENKKLTWKDKFKRDLFRQNIKFIQKNKPKKKDIREQEEKRAGAKCLSKLIDKNSIYVEDNQDQFPNHGHYSSYVPLGQQSKLNDELKSTFPYVEYLTEKNHEQTRANLYNEISNHLRTCVDNNTVQIGWRNCLKKFMCNLDVLKAIQIYIQLLKKGTGALQQLHKKYGKECSKQVFFHRVCASSKYFKESSKINKNVKTSIEYNEYISQVSLPKTSKFLFCPICLLYDCNQHNIDDTTTQFDYQYVARDNIVPKENHVSNILALIRFQKNICQNQGYVKEQSKQIGTDKQGQMEKQIDFQNSIDLQEQEIEDANSMKCSSACYKWLNKQSYSKKSTARRPIISLVHRSMINLAIDIFSYDPCLISLWVGNEILKQTTPSQLNKGIICENIFFYLIQEYNISKKLQYSLSRSEQEYLKNQSSRLDDRQKRISSVTFTKKKKQKPKFDHQNTQNYKIGCCYHYFKGQDVFDHRCEKCCCKKRGFCIPQCQCSSQCQIKKIACSCKSGKDECRTKKCTCFNNNQQCVPGLCLGCFNSQGLHNKKNCCRNSMILKQETKYIKIGDSNICGLGAFAGEDISKDDLVVIYTGQMIEHQIDYIREGLRFDDTFYNFGLYEGGAIDARFMGNKSRFINHQKGAEQNLQAFSFFSQGRFKTVLYAKKNIKKGQQLYFDYDVDGKISTDFPGKYDFIKKSKK